MGAIDPATLIDSDGDSASDRQPRTSGCRDETTRLRSCGFAQNVLVRKRNQHKFGRLINQAYAHANPNVIIPNGTHVDSLIPDRVRQRLLSGVSSRVPSRSHQRACQQKLAIECNRSPCRRGCSGMDSALMRLIVTSGLARAYCCSLPSIALLSFELRPTAQKSELTRRGCSRTLPGTSSPRGLASPY